MTEVDVVILGVGAAGLMAAGECLVRKRRVGVLDHAAQPGEEIRISGGGRYNFTNHALNRQNAPDPFLSGNGCVLSATFIRFTSSPDIPEARA